MIDSLFDTFSGVFFEYLACWILYAFAWLLDGFLWVLGLLVYYIVSGFFQCVMVLITTISSFVTVINFAGEYAGLPPALLYLLDVSGFVQGLAIISGAYMCRFLLNLIPAAFTRI